MFAKLGDIAFRQAESDRTPVLVMPMGQASAAVPLRSLQQELSIDNDSRDGQMLAQIAKALDFVGELRLGDRLPVEVLCGAASWAPGPLHRDIAHARLTLQLTAVFEPSRSHDAAEVGASWAAATPPRALAASRVPGMELRLQAAIIGLTTTLALPNPAAAQQVVDDLAHELSYIEALRERLLDRVVRMCGQIEALVQCLANNQSGLELISRVHRLAGIGLTKISARFSDVKVQTADVQLLFQTMEERRIMIRLHRDWLYCSLRAWEEILAAWAMASDIWCEATWPLLSRTYRFLAPRFMPMQEWLLTTRARRPGGTANARMTW